MNSLARSREQSLSLVSGLLSERWHGKFTGDEKKTCVRNELCYKVASPKPWLHRLSCAAVEGPHQRWLKGGALGGSCWVAGT
jgi:hypothetical protein